MGALQAQYGFWHQINTGSHSSSHFHLPLMSHPLKLYAFYPHPSHQSQVSAVDHKTPGKKSCKISQWCIRSGYGGFPLPKASLVKDEGQ